MNAYDFKLNTQEKNGTWIFTRKALTGSNLRDLVPLIAFELFWGAKKHDSYLVDHHIMFFRLRCWVKRLLIMHQALI